MISRLKIVIYIYVLSNVNNSPVAEMNGWPKYSEIFVSNLNTQCMRCLCSAASGCNLAAGCVQGFCGPFQISKAYWLDAGKQTLPGDDPALPEAYSNCATNYHCAQKVVKNYIAKFAKDCNGDGVTNCDDYAMINYNGGYRCEADLNAKTVGQKYAQRYGNCTLLNQ